MENKTHISFRQSASFCWSIAWRCLLLIETSLVIISAIVNIFLKKNYWETYELIDNSFTFVIFAIFIQLVVLKKMLNNGANLQILFRFFWETLWRCALISFLIGMILALPKIFNLNIEVTLFIYLFSLILLLYCIVKIHQIIFNNGYDKYTKFSDYHVTNLKIGKLKI